MTRKKAYFQPIHLIFSFLGGLVLLFIIAPLAGLLINSFGNGFFDTIRDKEVTDSILLTLLTSLTATLVFSIFSIPLAYLLARKNFPLKQLVLGLIDLPVVIPHSAAGIALLGFISRNTVVGKAADAIGLSFIGNPIGIALAMAFVSVPFLINAARDGFTAVPERYEKAAYSLGASPAMVFFTISLPLASRSILSGFIMMFARGMSEFGAIIIIAYHPMVTPVLIWERFSAYGLKYAQPVAAVFIIICLLFFIILRMLVKNKRNVRS